MAKQILHTGAQSATWTVLGLTIVEWFCSRVQLPAPLPSDVVGKLFERSAFRPEVIGSAADLLGFEFALEAKDVVARFSEAVERQIKEGEEQTLRVVHGLTPLQSTVLRVLAARGREFAPFEADTVSAYRKTLETIAPGERIEPDTSNVQQALMSLQEKSLIWKERRGVYAIEESSLADMMQERGMLDMVPPQPQSRNERQR